MSGVDVLLSGARDCLGQNVIYPADVAMAIRRINEARDAVAELIEAVESEGWLGNRIAAALRRVKGEAE